MNTRLARNVLAAIRNEKHLRVSLLDERNPEAAYDHWTFTDALFVAELCLMLLVALNHEVERQLLKFAAQAADAGQEINSQQYQRRVEGLKARSPGVRWKEINARLKRESCKGYQAVEGLRLLANCYKHDTSKGPDEKLLKLLNVATGVPYAPLPESEGLREGLAIFIGLEKGADYCDIAEEFLNVIDLHLAEIQRQTQLSRVKGAAASLNPRDFAR